MRPPNLFGVRFALVSIVLLSGCYQRHLLSDDPPAPDAAVPDVRDAAPLDDRGVPLCAESGGWRVETVSADATFGDVAVGVGEDGVVHVAFSRRDPEGSALLYGRRDSEGWDTAVLQEQVRAYPMGRSVALEMVGDRASLAYFGAAPESRAQAVWFRRDPFGEPELVTPFGRFLDVLRVPHVALGGGVVAFRGRVNGLVWAEPAETSWSLEPAGLFAPGDIATEVGPDGTRGVATRVDELVHGPGGAVVEVIERLSTHDRELVLSRRPEVATAHGCALEGTSLSMHERGYDVVVPVAERTFTGFSCALWHYEVAGDLRGGFAAHPFLPGESHALDMVGEAPGQLHVAVVQELLRYATGARGDWLVETVPVDASDVRAVRVAFGPDDSVAIALLRDSDDGGEIVVAFRGPC